MPIGATLGAAAIGGGASLGAAYMGSQAAGKAGRQQADAYRQAGDVYSPWAGAMTTLAQLYGTNGQGGGAFNPAALAQFRNTPGYQFTLGEGLRANDFGDSARGQLLSSNNQRGRADYASGLADKTFMGSYVSPLMQMAMTYGQGKANALVGQGSSMAGGTMGQANAWASGLGGVANAANGALGNYMNYQNNQNNTQTMLAMLNRGAYGGQPQSAFGGNQQWGNAWGNNGSFGAAG